MKLYDTKDVAKVLIRGFPLGIIEVYPFYFHLHLGISRGIIS